MPYNPDINIIVLIGLTLSAVDHDSETVTFTTNDDRQFRLYHDQNCCESVTVESIKGEVAHLIGSPITAAQEVIASERPADLPTNTDEWRDSETWTTFTLATELGQVVIRWCGSSNGYYSESVSFCEVK